MLTALCFLRTDLVRFIYFSEFHTGLHGHVGRYRETALSRSLRVIRDS